MNYDPSLIAKAYKDVTVHGYSVYKASRLHGIPESTLHDRTLGLQPAPTIDGQISLPKPGPSPIFSRTEEKMLIDHLAYMAEIGYGYSRKECIRLATDFAISLGKRAPSDPIFSDDWFSRLKKNWPEIHYAKPQKLAVVRAKATSEEVLDNYYRELKKVLEENDLLDRPDLIWNIDETGLLMEHRPTNVVCFKGYTPQSVTSPRGKTVTILACGSAMGTRLPPYYVFPGKRWSDSLLLNTCPGSAGTMSETGWSNSLVFMDFLEHHFKKYVALGQNTNLVLFDGHKSHVNLTLAEWGDKHKVKFFVLPPHTSHITQPLDVACFGPLKNAYYSECQAYMRQNPGLQISRYNVGHLSSKAYNKSLTPENLISAFKKTGIYPLNPNIMSKEKTAPSKIYIQSESKPSVSDSSHFLNTKKIVSINTTKKRKTPPTITGEINSQTSHLHKIEKIITSEKPNKSKPVPSTSGPKKIALAIHSEDEESDLEEIADEELCCVCHKFYAENRHLDYTIEFTSWGQCQKCEKWVHL